MSTKSTSVANLDPFVKKTFELEKTHLDPDIFRDIFKSIYI